MKYLGLVLMISILLVGCRIVQHREEHTKCTPPAVVVGPERTVSTQLCAIVDIVCYDKERKDCTVDFDTFHQELCVRLSDVPGRICKVDNGTPQHLPEEVP